MKYNYSILEYGMNARMNAIFFLPFELILESQNNQIGKNSMTKVYIVEIVW